MDSEDEAKTQVEKAQDAEELKERLEREYSELFEEIRVLIPGAQVLFGFLLAIRFTQQFAELSSMQENVYFVSLLSTAVALVLRSRPPSTTASDSGRGTRRTCCAKQTGRLSRVRPQSRWPSAEPCSS